MAGLEGEKFSKELYRKCSENRDYRYTWVLKLFPVGYFQHDCGTNSYIITTIVTEANVIKIFSFSRLDYHILYVLLNPQI